MKKISLVVLFFLLSCVSVASSFENEPDGFRGVMWGANLKDLPDMVADGVVGDEKWFKKNGDKLQVGEAELTDIVYGFYKDKFYTVIMGFDTFHNFKKVKEALFQKYGAGRQPNRYLERYLWMGENCTISLDFNSMNKKGMIYYVYKSLLMEKNKDEKEKAKKAADDL